MSKQPVPPEPSVQAGAREWLASVGVIRSGGEYYRLTGKPCPNDYERLSIEGLLGIAAQQVEEQTKLANDFQEMASNYQRDNETLAQQVEALRAALKTHGHHLCACAKFTDPVYGRLAYPDPEIRCSCGLDAALKAAQEGK